VGAARVRTTEQPWGTLVELCAPAVRNALDRDAVDALTSAVRAQGSGVVLLAGEGDVFCAGGDVTAMTEASARGSLADLLASAGAAFADLVEAIVTCPRPVVGAILGTAVGGGMTLALACDVRIAGHSTRLVPGWGRWGLPPDGGASALLASVVGPAAAAAVVIAGDALTTQSRLTHLLFDEVVADDDVLSTAIAAAERICANPGAAAAKAVTRPLLLPVLQAQRAVELEAMRRAADDPAVGAALAGRPR
jgi:2-(1,2-epoxy-1,2-dihydrophenyl)acetyl-CoA isomerase